MARFLQPSIALAIASGRASSRKNSAGPPMPNEVRDASASSSLTPARPRSQARRDLVRQVGRADSGDVFLARAVNVEHVHAVRAIESASEVVYERIQARVAMR